MTTVGDLANALSRFHPEEKLKLEADGRLLISEGEEVVNFHLREEDMRFYLAELLLPSIFEDEYNIDVMAMEDIHNFIGNHAEDIIAAVYERYDTTMRDHIKSLFLDMYAGQYGDRSLETLAGNIIIVDMEAALEDYPPPLDAKMEIARALLA